MITYAQNFEDVLLARVFRHKSNGFYIDVGAHDPTELSVTRYFYDLGWHGINIEPVPESHRLFVEQRPRDINLQIALGERFEMRALHVVNGHNRYVADPKAMSSFVEDAASHAVAALEGTHLRDIDVEVRTLAEVCRTYCKEPIDFIKIDVEGWEHQVIAGADLMHFRPVVLVVEATKPCTALADFANPTSIENWSNWEPVVLNAGYVFAHFDGLSRYYVRQEDAALTALFQLPPCVHDNIVFADAARIAPDTLARALEQDARFRDSLHQVTEVESELRGVVAVREKVEAALRAHHAYAESLQKEQDALRIQAQTATTRAESADAQLQALRKELALAVESRAQAEAALREAESRLEAVAGQVESADAQLQALRKELALAVESRAQADVALRESESRLEAVAGQAKAAEEQAKLRLDEATHRHEATLNEALRELVSLRGTSKRLTAELAAATGELDALRPRAEWLASDRDRLDTLAAQQQQSLGELEARGRAVGERQLQLEREVATLRASLQEFEQWGQTLKGEIERLDRLHGDAEQRARKLAGEQQSLEGENRKLAAERDELRQALTVIRQVARETEFRRRHRVWLALVREVPVLARLRHRLSLPPLSIELPAPAQAAQTQLPASAVESTAPGHRRAMPDAPVLPTTGLRTTPGPAVAGARWSLTAATAFLNAAYPAYWPSIAERLSGLRGSRTSSCLDLFCEVTLCGSTATAAGETEDSLRWTGLALLPPDVPAWWLAVPSQAWMAAAAGWRQPGWTQRRPRCDALAAPSNALSRSLEKLVGMPVATLRLPLPEGRRVWSWDAYAESRRVVQPAEWLQRSHAIAMLPSGQGIRKVWWRNRQLIPEDVVAAERNELGRDQRLLPSMLRTVTAEDEPSIADRVARFADSVMLLHLHDAAAPVALLECIASATPILINALPAVRELLGSDYPLYFYSYLDAAQKLADDALLQRAHEYLKALPCRAELTLESFVRELERL